MSGLCVRPLRDSVTAMATLFTRIINGEIPGRFVWSDPQCVGFLTMEPLRPGHTLVVPRDEIDQWTSLSPEALTQLMSVAQRIGRAQLEEFGAERIGLLIEGYGVPHAHVHVWPSQDTSDFDPHNVHRDVPGEELDAAAERLRSRLRTQGNGDFVPTS